jgi:hypothetical protein
MKGVGCEIALKTDAMAGFRGRGTFSMMAGYYPSHNAPDARASCLRRSRLFTLLRKSVNHFLRKYINEHIHAYVNTV